MAARERELRDPVPESRSIPLCSAASSPCRMCAQRCVRAAVLSGVSCHAGLDRGLDLHDTAVQLYLKYVY